MITIYQIWIYEGVVQTDQSVTVTIFSNVLNNINFFCNFTGNIIDMVFFSGDLVIKNFTKKFCVLNLFDWLTTNM